MNRNEYISELEESLKGKIPHSELNDILSDYNSFFDEGLREGKTEEQVAKDLGSPAKLARTILDDNSSDVKQERNSIYINNLTEVKQLNYASLGRRIGAFILDKLLIYFLMILIVLCTYLISINGSQQINESENLNAINDNNLDAVKYGEIDNITSDTPYAQPYSTTQSASYAIPIMIIIVLLSFLSPAFSIFLILSFRGAPRIVTVPFIIILLMLFLYKPVIQIILKGRTIGKCIMGIKVVKTEGSPAGSGNILLREIIGDFVLSSLSGGITTIVSLFTIALMKNHKSVADMIADTVVIKY